MLKIRLKLNLEMTESIKKRKSEKMKELGSLRLIQSLKSPHSSKQEDMYNFLSERNEGSVVSDRDRNNAIISINNPKQ